MARGIGNRQKKVVAAKKVWFKPSPAAKPRTGKRQDFRDRIPDGRKPDSGDRPEKP